jgi:precorrin-8X/cobalt-precorrin-8 methylmutase
VFDTFLMVDWSAARVPRTGPDSIWICRRDEAGTVLWNPPTRSAARDRLAEEIAAARRKRRRVLVGFDFPFGYPAGTAARLELAGTPWRALWDLIARDLVDDGATNANNRFEVAAALNRRMTGGPFPFWGHPAGETYEGLLPRRQKGDIAERRLADINAPGTQPVWKLYGAGSAGGQALAGIPVVRALRDDPRWCGEAAVWPFETGLGAPDAAAVVFAEIYPSLVSPQPEPGEPKDAGQVRAIAGHFAAHAGAGTLAALFAGDPTLGAESRRAVVAEEGWILGVTTRSATTRPPRTPRVYDYVRDPQAIYRQSFAHVRAAADLGRLPPELHRLALRLAHAAGDVAILDGLAWSPGAVASGEAALRGGMPILADAAMVASGITRERLPARNAVLCTLRAARVPALAARLGTTRSAAAVELWRTHLPGAVVAIGNAPTALFHLLEMLRAGAPPPALVLGFPVGFVGAAEAKEALAGFGGGLAYVTLHGNRGGSALAAAAVNALAQGEPA